MFENKSKLNLFTYRDMSDYGQGYYYEDWRHAAASYFSTQQMTKRIFPLNSQIQTVLYGHSIADMIVRKHVSNTSLTVKLEKMLYQGNFKIRPSLRQVVFSKNDYKNFDEKIYAYKRQKIDLVVTHTLKAQSIFEASGLRCTWLPFGFNPENFFVTNKKKRIFKVGFRGNLNSQYLEGQRDYFLKRLSELDLKIDVVTSNQGENFLYGIDYVNWMNECLMIFNTESAYNTVGPKWYEQMACGVVPLAPKAHYEGLFLPWENYIPVDSFFEGSKLYLK